jgi:hypothetical protein
MHNPATPAHVAASRFQSFMNHHSRFERIAP